jgi:alkanesulfonate monooxygenase SsuD/methylene tetrahydromethanopterin reductase-like flavin-dependent oxidoreductase (luciferase family)
MRGAAGEGVSRAFGVTAGLDPEIASPLAGRCQELGYDSMWSNDHPGAKGLETLAEYARGADRIDLGVAVIALDRQSPEEIAADIERLGIDKGRLWLGIGAGFTEKPLTTVREALPGLREALPDVRLVLAAMGPKMCAFAGAEWDGAFFNWITPDFAGKARGWVEAGASEVGREPPTIFGYVRTAVGDNAEGRLATDESFYRDMHQGYRRHFDRQGAPEGTVGVAGENESVVQAGLARFRALDVTVVRGLASATIEDMSAVAEAAAPGD